MRSKTDSWKQKIDPAFDKIIRLYLFYLESFQLPANEGYLAIQLPDNYSRKLEIEGFPSIASIYVEKTLWGQIFILDIFTQVKQIHPTRLYRPPITKRQQEGELGRCVLRSITLDKGDGICIK